MAESKKGHNFAKLGPTDKKIRVHLFFVLVLRFQVPSSSDSLALLLTKGLADGRTGPNQYAPQLLQRWGHKKHISYPGILDMRMSARYYCVLVLCNHKSVFQIRKSSRDDFREVIHIYQLNKCLDPS